MGGANVFAEELQEYSLDPMVITAQRMETKDLKTPAAVEVVTKEKIENSGAGSAYDVLQNSFRRYVKRTKIIMVQQWVL